MSYYSMGDSFKWFMARVIDIKDPESLGRVKVRVIHEQTGELGKKRKTFGIVDDDLLWAYPLSAIQSASLSWKKIVELENYPVPDWIDAVGLSPTGIAVGSYAFGFYLDGHEANIPMIFATYHKISVYPEPPTDPQTGEMLQIKPPEDDKPYYDVAALAKGFIYDPEAEETRPGQTLPKEPYSISSLWKESETDLAPVDEFVSAYNAEYPYNLTYTTKSGHAIELDDTIGVERIHIWHKSGSYEEISSGNNPTIDDDNRKDWPIDGPVGYSYKTAGGIDENKYDGRRNRKTMDSFFDTVVKDRNELTLRDHNTEVANTETMKIGNTQFITIGHKTIPDNRINDNGETDYASGGLGELNAFFDVANNTTHTTGNNFSIQVGYTPDSEYRFKEEDVFNAFMDIANNNFINIGNNETVSIGNNQVITIANNQTVTIGSNCTIIVQDSASITVANTANIYSGGKMTIGSGVEVEINAPIVDINGSNSITITGGTVDVDGSTIDLN